MMQEIVSDELSYTVITGVNEKLRDIAAEYANEPDLPVVDDIHVRDILLDSGVSQNVQKRCRWYIVRQRRTSPLWSIT